MRIAVPVRQRTDRSWHPPLIGGDAFLLTVVVAGAVVVDLPVGLGAALVLLGFALGFLFSKVA